MSDASNVLQNWFDNLSRDQQNEVLEFLYGGKALFQKGLYSGPYPGLVTRGLHCGPAPQLTANNVRVCPACGRPL
jgi:hypothetical protein